VGTEEAMVDLEHLMGFPCDRDTPWPDSVNGFEDPALGIEKGCVEREPAEASVDIIAMPDDDPFVGEQVGAQHETAKAVPEGVESDDVPGEYSIPMEQNTLWQIRRK